MGRVHYRILYFFHGSGLILLAHALSKEGKVPTPDISRAVERRRKYLEHPASHCAEVEP